MHDLLKAHQEEQDTFILFIPDTRIHEAFRELCHIRDRALLKRVYEEEKEKWIHIYEINTDEKVGRKAKREIDRLDNLIKQLN